MEASSFLLFFSYYFENDIAVTFEYFTSDSSVCVSEGKMNTFIYLLVCSFILKDLMFICEYDDRLAAAHQTQTAVSAECRLFS